MAKEIERKFLLPKYPQQEIEAGKLECIAQYRFEQTYLALSENEEIRVRKIEQANAPGQASFYHTFKKGTGLTREEIEYQISEDIYQQLIIGKSPLIKERTRVVAQGIEMEIDVYQGFDFITIEVEFPSEEEANAFVPPAWFGEEIGSQKEFRNKTLWKSLQDKGGAKD